MPEQCDVIAACPDRETAEAFVRRILPQAGGFLAESRIFLPLGKNPSRQRNLALRHARAPYVLFLDSDVETTEAYWRRVREHLARGEVDVAGGPVILREEATRKEKIFQAALSHRGAVGRTASRYRPSGVFRRSDESEVILCNLLVRRSLFEKFGFFDERLYPNEENEWMERLPSGTSCYYDPGMPVARPQRATWTAFGGTLIRYGEGRTRQTLLARRPSAKNLPGLGLLAWLVLLPVRPREALALALASLLSAWGFYFLTLDRAEAEDRVPKSAAATLAVCCYALGQILGLGRLGTKKRADETVCLLQWPAGGDRLAEAVIQDE